ncbi:hypothetical protein L1987_52291 [Smallanthus sonchifolius]|uniref:Uncharacterized protein n=1 Tax=Smallanthus sonchifolius TaxID=185202 RepID=A0ACB9ESP3_9ASTR|nr:hypothetical protein L1987_52291 [Smallanthus sonchifolius]
MEVEGSWKDVPAKRKNRNKGSSKGNITKFYVEEKSISIPEDTAAFKELTGKTLVGRCKDLVTLRRLNILIADTRIPGISLREVLIPAEVAEPPAKRGSELKTNEVNNGDFFSHVNDENGESSGPANIPMGNHSPLEEDGESGEVITKGNIGINSQLITRGIETVLVSREYNRPKKRIREEGEFLFDLNLKAGDGQKDVSPNFKETQEAVSSMNIMSINIRGIIGGSKSSWVKDLRSANKISIIALQETMVESVTSYALASFWGNRNFEFAYAASEGRSGGLVWMWDPKVIKIESVTRSMYFLFIKGFSVGSGDPLNLINVYAPQNTSAKLQLWSDLSGRINSSEGQWVLAGDFNAVRSPEERKRSKYKQVCAENFNNFIYNNGLLEYPMQGRRFTCIRDNGKKLSKLDRFLVCSEFFNKWPTACVRVMPSRHSDHCPIILELVDLNFGPRPFRVFNSWIGKPGFEEAVKAASWRDDFLAKESENVKMALSELEQLESDLETRDISEEEEWIMAENRKIIEDVEERKNMDLKQRARIKWAIEGDENTKYFHALVNNRKASNLTHGLSINGVWCTKPAKIKKQVFTFFRDRFKDHLPIRPDLICHNIKKISDSDSSMLIEEFSAQEIRDAVLSAGMIGLRAQMAISKAIANRMRKVLDGVISEPQSAFLKGRYILDGPLIVNELITWIKKRKSKAFFLKIDFEKAYDNVSWNFVINTLLQMGFPNKWCDWILGILKSASSSVLVNGAPTYIFKCEKGMRQGDPLSPFLFLVVMEALSCMLNRAREEGTIKGIATPNNGPIMTHLLYADDAIVVGEWSKIEVVNIVRILRCFHLCSGLKINIEKSNLFGIGVGGEEVGDMAREVGCNSDSLPFKYLGLKVGANLSQPDQGTRRNDRIPKQNTAEIT